jgi:hypothetical protein
MPAIFVLIIVSTFYYHDNISVKQHDYNSQESCEYAAEAINKAALKITSDLRGTMAAFCVPK